MAVTEVTLHKIGDFYEAFGNDALIVARVLGVTVTRAHDSRELAGIPYWAVARDTKVLKAEGIEVHLA